jgi:hypothetical protein
LHHLADAFGSVLYFFRELPSTSTVILDLKVQQTPPFEQK